MDNSSSPLIFNYKTGFKGSINKRWSAANFPIKFMHTFFFFAILNIFFSSPGQKRLLADVTRKLVSNSRMCCSVYPEVGSVLECFPTLVAKERFLPDVGNLVLLPFIHRGEVQGAHAAPIPPSSRFIRVLQPHVIP